MSLIPSAYAAPAAGAAPQGSSAGSLLLLVVLFGFLFFLWYPQQKRMKQMKKMLSELHIGDEVMTSGGVVGKITQLEESFLKLTIAKDVSITLQKSAVSALLPKGTMKSV